MDEKNKHPLKYRADIDGLRAFAVLTVVLFHVDRSYLSGGFLGVDVFFVISGFLITSIIYTEMSDKTFSFSDFYSRRMRRILPALYFTLLLTAIASYIIMLPYDLFKYGISLVSVISFISNLQFTFRTGDYFSSDSTEWPLLHTWSLAVEEQYYFVIPFLLLLLMRTPFVFKLAVLLIIACASFVLAEFWSRMPSMGSASYYLVITRLGELMIGSIMAILFSKEVIKPIKSELATSISLALMLFLVFWVDRETIFPGVYSMAICIPVAILIASQGTIVNKLLSLKPVVFVGLISYSLYLMHWPVLAMARYIFNIDGKNQPLLLNQQLVLIAIFVTLALISYFFIEKNTRRVKWGFAKTTVYTFIVPSAILGSFALAAVLSKGMPSRFDHGDINGQLQYTHKDFTLCPEFSSVGCKNDMDSKYTKDIAMLYGDSHAEHYFEFVYRELASEDVQTSMYGAGGCEPATNTSKCTRMKEQAENSFKNYEYVILAFRWDEIVRKEKSLQETIKLFEKLKSEGKRITILAQPPLLSFNPSKAANCQRLGLNCSIPVSISDSYPKYNSIIEELALEYDIKFIDPFDYVDNRFAINHESTLYYSDNDHLSVYGARWLQKNFSKNSTDSLLDFEG